VLAYVFWHRPRPEADVDGYEAALVGFHRSLAHSRPAGLEASASFRVAELPWIEGEGTGYEDWYLLDGFSSLGVLNEAAVGRGHRSAHDHAARQTALGTAGLYALQDGDTKAWEQGVVGVWVEREPGSAAPALGDLLADGVAPEPACLWRRQMSFGPAPEFCLHASQTPAGVGEGRLPAGWVARAIARAGLARV
jgi:hypothetical protein